MAGTGAGWEFMIWSIICSNPVVNTNLSVGFLKIGRRRDDDEVGGSFMETFNRSWLN